MVARGGINSEEEWCLWQPGVVLMVERSDVYGSQGWHVRDSQE